MTDKLDPNAFTHITATNAEATQRALIQTMIDVRNNGGTNIQGIRAMSHVLAATTHAYWANAVNMHNGDSAERSAFGMAVLAGMAQDFNAMAEATITGKLGQVHEITPSGERTLDVPDEFKGLTAPTLEVKTPGTASPEGTATATAEALTPEGADKFHALSMQMQGVLGDFYLNDEGEPADTILGMCKVAATVVAWVCVNATGGDMQSERGQRIMHELLHRIAQDADRHFHASPDEITLAVQTKDGVHHGEDAQAEAIKRQEGKAETIDLALCPAAGNA